MKNVCNFCKKEIPTPEVMIDQLEYHYECLVCQGCKKSVIDTPFRMRDVSLGPCFLIA